MLYVHVDAFVKWAGAKHNIVKNVSRSQNFVQQLQASRKTANPCGA
jgi:hypothetical protein